LSSWVVEHVRARRKGRVGIGGIRWYQAREGSRMYNGNRWTRAFVCFAIIATILDAVLGVGIGELTVAEAAVQATELSAEEIIARVDGNAYWESSRTRSRMIIRQGNRELVKEMLTWGDGDGNGFVEFVNPADRGTKYLKLGEDLWMFFPDADDLVRISGHMLRQGIMGSDFSYEDALESERLQELYEFALIGVEACAEGECYVLEAAARPGARVAYAQRKMWVDTEYFVLRQEELYAASGRLLKVARMEEIKVIGGRHVATRLTMEDVLRRNTSTTLVLDELELDVEIPEGMFSLQSLMR